MTKCEQLQNKAIECYDKAREQGQGLMYIFYMKLYNFYIKKIDNCTLDELKQEV